MTTPVNSAASISLAVGTEFARESIRLLREDLRAFVTEYGALSEATKSMGLGTGLTRGVTAATSNIESEARKATNAVSREFSQASGTRIGDQFGSGMQTAANRGLTNLRSDVTRVSRDITAGLTQTFDALRLNIRAQVDPSATIARAGIPAIAAPASVDISSAVAETQAERVAVAAAREQGAVIEKARSIVAANGFEAESIAATTAATEAGLASQAVAFEKFQRFQNLSIDRQMAKLRELRTLLATEGGYDLAVKRVGPIVVGEVENLGAYEIQVAARDAAAKQLAEQGAIQKLGITQFRANTDDEKRAINEEIAVRKEGLTVLAAQAEGEKLVRKAELDARKTQIAEENALARSAIANSRFDRAPLKSKVNTLSDAEAVLATPGASAAKFTPEILARTPDLPALQAELLATTRVTETSLGQQAIAFEKFQRFQNLSLDKQILKLQQLKALIGTEGGYDLAVKRVGPTVIGEIDNLGVYEANAAARDAALKQIEEQAAIQKLGLAESAAYVEEEKRVLAEQNRVQKYGVTQSKANAAEMDRARAEEIAQTKLRNQQQRAAITEEIENYNFRNASLKSRVTTLGKAAAVQDRLGPTVAATEFTPEILALTPALPLLRAQLKDVEEQHARAGAAAKLHAQDLKTTRAAMVDVHSASRGLAGSLGALWATWGSPVPIIAAAAIGSSLVGIVAVGAQVENQLAFIRGMTGEVATLKQLLDTTKGSMFTPKESVDGLRELTQAGVSVSDSFAVLPDVMRLATLGSTSVGQAALTATGTVNAFGLSISEVARVGDVFAKAAAISNTSVAGIESAMKQASTVAEEYKIKLEEMGAVLVTLAKRNIDYGQAGTSVTNFLRQLYTPTTKAQKAMDELKFSAFDAATGGLKPVTQVLDELSVKLNRFGEKGRLTLLTEMSDRKGAKAASAVLSDMEAYHKNLDRLKEADGFLVTANAELALSTENTWKRMKASTEGGFAQAFEKAAPSIQSLIGALDKIASSTGFVDYLTRIAVGLAETGRTIGEHIGQVGLIVAAYLGLRTASTLVVLVTNAVAFANRAAAVASGEAAAATGIETATVRAHALAEEVDVAATRANTLSKEANIAASVASAGANGGNTLAMGAETVASAGLAVGLRSVAGALGALGILVLSAITLWDLFNSKTIQAKNEQELLEGSIGHTVKVLSDENDAMERQIKLQKQLLNRDYQPTSVDPNTITANLEKSKQTAADFTAQRDALDAKRAAVKVRTPGISESDWALMALERSNQLRDIEKERLTLNEKIAYQLAEQGRLEDQVKRSKVDRVEKERGSEATDIQNKAKNLRALAKGDPRTEKFETRLRQIGVEASVAGTDIGALRKEIDDLDKTINGLKDKRAAKVDKGPANREYSAEVAEIKEAYNEEKRLAEIEKQGQVTRATEGKKAGIFSAAREIEEIDKAWDHYRERLVSAGVMALAEMKKTHRATNQDIEAIDQDREARKILRDKAYGKAQRDEALKNAEFIARLDIQKESAKVGAENTKIQKGEIRKLDDADKKFDRRFMSEKDAAIEQAAIGVFEQWEKRIDQLREKYDKLLDLRKEGLAVGNTELAQLAKEVEGAKDQRNALTALAGGKGTESGAQVYAEQTKRVDELAAAYEKLAKSKLDAVAADDPQLAQRAKEIADTKELQTLMVQRAKTQTGKLEDKKLSFESGVEDALNKFAKSAQDNAKIAEHEVTSSIDKMSTALENFAITGKLNFKDLANSIIADIARTQMKAAASSIFSILGKMAISAIGSYFGGAAVSGTGLSTTGYTGGLGSAATSTGAGAGLNTTGYSGGFGSATTTSGAGYGLKIPGQAHTGGIVGGSLQSHAPVDISVFSGAPRFHTGGLVGGEVPIIAKKGEGVFTPEQMSRLAPAGSGTPVSQVNVTVNIDQGGNSQSDTQTKGNNTGRELGTMIEGVVAAWVIKNKRPGGELAT